MIKSTEKSGNKYIYHSNWLNLSHFFPKQDNNQLDRSTQPTINQLDLVTEGFHNNIHTHEMSNVLKRIDRGYIIQIRRN